MKVTEMVKALTNMSAGLEVKVTHSGYPQYLTDVKTIDNHVVLVVDYTNYDKKSEPKTLNLTVKDLLAKLNSVSGDYDVVINAYTQDGGYEGQLDGTWLNAMVIDSIQVVYPGFVAIDTNDNDDEERYGRTIKIAA